jgi:hypothetical protein
MTSRGRAVGCVSFHQVGSPAEQSNATHMAFDWMPVVHVPWDIAAGCVANGTEPFASASASDPYLSQEVHVFRALVDAGVGDDKQAEVVARPGEDPDWLQRAVHTLHHACWPWLGVCGDAGVDVDSDSDASEEGIGLWQT